MFVCVVVVFVVVVVVVVVVTHCYFWALRVWIPLLGLLWIAVVVIADRPPRTPRMRFHHLVLVWV